MLMCMERKVPYNVTLPSTIHILAQMWTNTPAAVVSNCFRHSGFGQPEPSESPQVTVPDEEDRALDALLSAEIQLTDYFGIADGVIVAGQ